LVFPAFFALHSRFSSHLFEFFHHMHLHLSTSFSAMPLFPLLKVNISS
jgi:hypothetical protein